ncbi:hypothetical protein EHP00_925 [Ecytonucleospora hepatopenaei]|uniref:Uncharacterized protein n=1 Tax=Ecytonucleospora hepatopenaei TaxID=646526 RepID=A0A1W0E4U6_9MICR|nr:hypothetical protein EHP00_925 [Ecytonucleospora hepatopenaei]
MSFKRKRNIKFDPLNTYNVFFLDTFDTEEIEDYVETKATGMEEDEEKEIQLQNVIRGKDKEIPLPVFSKIERKCKYMHQVLKNFINIQKDVENKYILSKEDKKELNQIKKYKEQVNLGSFKIKTNGGLVLIYECDAQKTLECVPPEQLTNAYDFETAVKTFGEDVKYCNSVKNNQFVDFVLRKTLIRYEKKGFEAYTCFKPRIIMPKMKSRKNEQQTIEKLQRMYNEFLYIEKSCEIQKSIIEKEQEVLSDKFYLIENYGEKFNSSIRRKLNYKKEKTDVNDLFYVRKKIKKEIESINLLSDQFFDNNFVEIEEDENKVNDNKKERKSTIKLIKNRFNCKLEEISK